MAPAMEGQYIILAGELKRQLQGYVSGFYGLTIDDLRSPI